MTITIEEIKGMLIDSNKIPLKRNVEAIAVLAIQLSDRLEMDTERYKLTGWDAVKVAEVNIEECHAHIHSLETTTLNQLKEIEGLKAQLEASRKTIIFNESEIEQAITPKEE